MIVTQQVVRLQRVWGDELDAFQIPAGELQIPIGQSFHEKNRLRVAIQARKHLAERLGLVRIELPGIHHGQLLLSKLRGKRRAQSAEKHFFWQAVCIAARHWSVDRAALAPDRAANRSYARA